jgi:triphosphatase
MAREIELKLEVEPGAAEALTAAPPLAGRPVDELELAALYLDTPRGALRKAGLSLRVRREGARYVQTLKDKGSGGAGLVARGEWDWELAGLDPDPALLAGTPAARVLKNGHRLTPLSETQMRRRLWRIDGIELSLDEGRVRSGTREAAVAELELELKEGEDPAALFALAERLAEAAPLRIGVLSKAERGERLADGRLGRAAKAEKLALDPETDVAGAFAAIAHACLRHYRLNEMVLLAEAEPGALHQARVAMRRLRSAFSLFGAVVRDAAQAPLREELRWFTGELGDARNLDVLLKRLPKKARKSDAALRARLEEAREAAYARARAAIRSERLRRLLLGLVRWIETGAWRESKKARRPIAKFARKRLDGRWQKVAALGPRLGELDEEPRHRLRIEIKKLRYAAEFLAGLQRDAETAERRTAFLAAMEALQDHLGDLNDAATAREILSGLGLTAREEDRLIGRGPDEPASIAAAERAFADLAAVGPYWR